MVLKDLDWINSGRKLHLGVDKKRRLLAQVKKDCALLERLEVIDYSMLVGIHRTASARERRTSSYIKVGWVLRLALALSRQLCPAARHTQVGSSARSSCDSVKSSAAGVPLQLGSALAGPLPSGWVRLWVLGVPHSLGCGCGTVIVDCGLALALDKAPSTFHI